MNTYILTARIDDATGELGYCLDCLPQFDDMPSVAHEGLIIAHDLLEHQNGPENIGTIADELQALGAMWFIRGQFGDLRRDNVGSANTTYENVAGDISRQVRDYLYKDETLPALDYDADHVCADDWEHILECARKSSEVEPDEMAEYGDKVREFFDRVPALLAQGWDKAEKRFPHGAPFANNLFWNIAYALQPYMNADFEGQQIALSFDENDCGSVHACEHYELDDDERACDECGDWFEPDGREHENDSGYMFCGDCWEREQSDAPEIPDTSAFAA